MAIRLDDKYPGRVNPADPSYTDGSIKNETVPNSSNDGTPLDELWGNDIEGFKQAVFLEAGVVPNDTPDTILNSQWLSGLKKILGLVRDDYALLRLVESNELSDRTSCIVTDDGIGGNFVLDKTDVVTADNSGTVIVDADGGRWKRLFSGAVDVKWFGAVGDGVADDTAACQAAIDSLGVNPGTVNFSDGTYLITSTLIVANDRQHLIGDAVYVSMILFEPTADDICISITKGALVINQGSIRDITIFSNDSTYEKIAIEISDQSRYLLENIVVGGSVAVSGTSMWSGGAGGSTGISFKGREYGVNYNLELTCDKPIVIGDNPNSTIDIDHYAFHNLYMIGNLTQPLITIEDGVNLTNVTFSGAQPWVRGSYGLYWNDTTSVGVSLNLSINNVRTEQGGVAAAYSVYINHNTGLHGFNINNSTFDSARDGIYLREVDNFKVSNHETAGTEEVLNVDSTVRGITIDNCFWQAGTTAVMTNQRQTFGVPKFPSTGALPPNATYEVDTSEVARNLVIGGSIGQEKIVIADNGIVTLGQTTMGGILMVTDSEYVSAIFGIKGTNNAVDEISDVVGLFSTVAGTAAQTNVYWNGATSRYEIENKRGASRTYRITFMGTYSSGF